jgi:hypothetical protein
MKTQREIEDALDRMKRAAVACANGGATLEAALSLSIVSVLEWTLNATTKQAKDFEELCYGKHNRMPEKT